MRRLFFILHRGAIQRAVLSRSLIGDARKLCFITLMQLLLVNLLICFAVAPLRVHLIIYKCTFSRINILSHKKKILPKILLFYCSTIEGFLSQIQLVIHIKVLRQKISTLSPSA